ncbi:MULTISPECIES: GGDEF domain-containing protein [Thermotoga]|jgi:diguanylate cyclase (GGDEF)-like protein|uniref:Diguanylate cyclase n=1 Tax=Thermotoga neapolitana (strain ATCC 49049 / DSM 4359 / NBRC 107923 / NS-E) TaxID=309803 RepID=B9K7G1_THENN|nr:MULTISPECIES: GGDEF domain-containing protein [Thermotoga]ACM22894.1 Diguanylate cyclase [Thermotoga neapolitana DSM 4359]AJG40816.1 diguanylate cyclase [Thermotoga sp. RQ7]KFZ22005.1 Diguanylate cyclase [Thermotoga neapolitana LA10]HBF11445.1 GGDEF domain-containing protein [Thermotoga neapolitana]
MKNGRFEFLKRVLGSIQSIRGFVLFESVGGELSVKTSVGKVPLFFKEGFSFTTDEIFELLKFQCDTAVVSVMKDREWSKMLVLFLEKPLEKETLSLIQSLMSVSECEDLFFDMKELEYMAYHDPLTGLPNRRYFFELGGKYLDIAKREDKKVFILFLDLSGFKKINDTYGHPFGDEVLKTVSKRILDRIRKSDVISRFGGDEFTLLLYDMKEDYLDSFLKRLFSAFKMPVKIGNTEISVSANVGVARFPEDGTNLEELLKMADSRMYEAKKMKIPYVFV